MVDHRMGHRGQIHHKTATDDQRQWLADLVDEMGLDQEVLRPADERDDEGRRVSVTAHVNATERREMDERAARGGVPTATLARLYLRLGQSVSDEIEEEWARGDGDEEESGE